MALVDLKRTKKQMKNDIPAPVCDDDFEKYPWGLTLRFEDDTVNKIPGLKNVKVGDFVFVNAKASVVEVREVDKKKGKSKSVELQIQQIEIVGESDYSDSFKESSE